MKLQEFVKMVKGKESSEYPGEYIGKCPAHPDKYTSLMIRVRVSSKDGRERIYVKCHAGCMLDQVLHAMGISCRDLIVVQE